MMGIDLRAIPLEMAINILNIVVLFLLVRGLVYKPAKRFMDERRARIETELHAAQNVRGEIEASTREHERSQAESLERANAALREKQEQVVLEAESILNRAKQQAQEIIRQAREQAETDHQRALLDLKDEVAALAVNIAEKMLRRELNEGDNQAIVDAFFDEVV
jgi:F-type H+-transporting ATPase subunit b